MGEGDARSRHFYERWNADKRAAWRFCRRKERVSERRAREPPTSGIVSRLIIARITHSSEGEFQCSAIVRGIVLSDGAVVDSRLVSAPIKLRRARITKFERYESETINVREGDVARIRCLGMPDVIPTPEVWFERLHDGVRLGHTSNQRFIATPTALQIALAQPADSGRYVGTFFGLVSAGRLSAGFAVLYGSQRFLERDQGGAKADRAQSELVRRAQHSPSTMPQVEPNARSHNSHRAKRKPKLVWPIARNASEPIELHVVEGTTALLECIIEDAVVRWTRADSSPLNVSLHHDRARHRQLFGNLRIAAATVADSADYVCHGLADFNDDLRRADHLRVVYRLKVHTRSGVHLALAARVASAAASESVAWDVACRAYHLDYEVPMLFVNGIALIDAHEQFGVPPRTNFFVNPLNVSLRTRSPLSGSVQCISRPAAVEAELYGANLERGRAMNLYIAERAAARPTPISPTTVVATRDSSSPPSTNTASSSRAPQEASTIAVTEASDFASFEISKPSVFIDSENNARLQWKASSAATSGVPIAWLLEFRRRPTMIGSAQNASAASLWSQNQRVPSHVRAGKQRARGQERRSTIRFAATIRHLDSQSQYQFRVVGHFGDGVDDLASAASDWQRVGGVRPSPSVLTRLEATAGDPIWTILGVRGSAYLGFVITLAIAIPCFCFFFLLLLRRVLARHGDRLHSSAARDASSPLFSRRRQRRAASPPSREDFFDKNQLVYQDSLYLSHHDEISELAPLNYAKVASANGRDESKRVALQMNESDEDVAHALYAADERPLAGIRARGSQVSLERVAPFARFLPPNGEQRESPDDVEPLADACGAFSTRLFDGDQHSLAASAATRAARSPSVTRSTLSVFRPPQRRRPPPPPSTAISALRLHSPTAADGVAAGELQTATTSPGGSATSGHGGLLPPPPPTLRSATSVVELSSFRSTQPLASMRTFGGGPLAGSSLLASQVMQTGLQ